MLGHLLHRSISLNTIYGNLLKSRRMSHASNKKDDETSSAKGWEHVYVCQGITKDLQIYLLGNTIDVQFNQIL